MMSGVQDAASGDAQWFRLLELSFDGLFEVNGEGRCTSCNPAAARFLGFEASDLIGTVVHDSLHPGGAALASSDCPFCQTIQAAALLRNGGQPLRARGVLSHKDGRDIPVLYTVVPAVIKGEVRGVFVMFTDDSEHERVAKELRERIAELAESERHKTEFIATLAHELRNPLAPLRAALQVMKKASVTATSMAELRGMMERQLEQLVGLLNDLLDVARVSSGQVSLRKERVALQHVLQLAVEASEPSRMATQNPLTLEVPDAPLYLNADPIRLTQAFTNILNNASQYSGAGGPITVKVDSDEHTVRIDIGDAGVGIAREALHRIFDMFTRAGRDASKRNSGLGIGLNLTRRMVELHDGQVVALSEGLGKGSHFVVTLPLHEPQELNSSAKSSIDATPGRPIRAMIVDDNVDAASSLRLLLELGGHDVRTAHTGRDAIRLAPDFKPDVVLLDIGMPEMDGYEVARALRAMPQLGRLVLVAITGWGGPEDRVKSKAAGFDEHLTKPVDGAIIELLFATLAARGLDTAGLPPLANGDSVDRSN